MFNEKSIGRRVISKTEGIGTISKYTAQDGDFDAYITVTFESARFYNYFLSGKMLGFETDRNEDLIYLHIKQGSPDARRIVAMLAVRYRKAKHARMITLPYRTPYIIAKQILTEEQ